jgi:hypothetical protein
MAGQIGGSTGGLIDTDGRLFNNIFGPGFQQVAPPSKFTVQAASDKKSLVFTVGDPLTSPTRRNKATYRVYFVPIGLAPPGRIARPNVARELFGQSTMITSASAPQNGGFVQMFSTTYAGLDGWFFATAVNGLGVESDPVGPVRNPIIGLNDTRIPPDVSSPAVVFEDDGLDPAGRQIVKAVCSCQVPYQTQGVSLTTVTNGGVGYTADFQVTYTGGGGSGASGLAHVAGGAVDFVEMIAAGSGYTTNPTPDFSAGDGTGAAGTTSLTTTGSFQGVQIYLGNYFQAGIIVEGPMITGGTAPQPGTTISGDFLLLADTPPPHDVKFYFVSVSQTGTRTDTPSSEPFVDKPNGVGVGL